jgi:hypothetical protein
MKTKLAWIILGLLTLAVFLLTFMKTPEAISAILRIVSKEVETYSVIVHLLFILVVAAGLIVSKIRNVLFFLFMAFLSLSATVISVIYAIVPNIIIFALFLILTIHAYVTKRLVFPLSNLRTVDWLFGLAGLVFGFWYLHWVEEPVWINALLYSPLGAVNCPTMVTICGFLCLSQAPRSPFLEAVVAMTTLYFGFFGLFRLHAYVDIVLIICALFLIVRLTSYMTLNAPRTATSDSGN